MSFNAKIRLVAFFFCGIFALVWLRLAYWQVFQNERLTAEAEAQHFYSLGLPATRGEIDFSDGLPLVSNKESYLLFANLPKIDKSKIVDTASSLADVLAVGVPLVATDSAEISPVEREIFLKSTRDQIQAKIVDRLNLQNAVWVNLANFVDQVSKDKIDSLKISGIEFATEQTRDYPEASMAAHLVGFVGADQNGAPKGYFGLEGFYDRELSGKSGEQRIEKDAFGRPIAIGEESIRDRRNGNDLVTTIDRGVQYFVENDLQQGIKDWQASGGTAIVMKPDGAIVALANFPRYDPLNFSYYQTSLYKNPAVADQFEPGSIMKPLVMAAAINENKVDPETRCDKCAGPREIGGFFVHTFNNEYHPNLTMTETLINSDNTGMIFVGEKLGFDNLYAYFNRFGLNSDTGVDLEEEEGGRLRPKDNYYPVDQATMTFGQGIVVNSMQMVRGFAALANGGNLITPYIVSQIRQPTGEMITLRHPSPKRVISEATSKTITQMLIRVANESPEHFPKDRIKQLKDYQIAAKSGTAQIALGGKYKEQGTTASLIGYFPAQNPKFVVYVKLNEPELRPWGSDTAGPIFFAIIRDLIFRYGIAP